MLNVEAPPAKAGNASEEAGGPLGPFSMETVGGRLRRARERRNLSIRQLEEISGVKRNTISRAEQGYRIAYDSLVRICNAMGVYIGDLFESGHADSVVAIQRAGEAVWLPRNNEDVPKVGDSSRLSTADQRKTVVAVCGPMNFIFVHDSRAPEGKLWTSVLELYMPTPTRIHPGEECLLVLSGRILLTVSGRSYELGEGDSAGFHSTEPHTYAPIGPDLPARIYTVTARPSNSHASPSNGKNGGSGHWASSAEE